MTDENTREINRAIRQLNSISRTAAPKATAQAVNKVTSKALSSSIRDTGKSAKIPTKSIRRYAKVSRKATAANPESVIRVRRNDVPAIHITTTRNQIRRNMQRYKSRNENGRRRRNYSRVRAGKYVFQNAFLTKLQNGKWHIMQRTSDGRYPIKLVAVPIRTEITQSFQSNANALMRSDMSLETARALTNQIRLIAGRNRR